MIFGPITVADKNNDSCVIRSLSQEDGAALTSFVEQGVQETPHFPWAPGESELASDNAAEYILEFEHDERRLLLGAFRDARLIGLIELSNYGDYEKTRHRGTAGSAMLGEARGIGLGKKLLQTAIATARELGYEQLEATTATVNEAAISSLRSSGFQEYGMIPHRRKNEDGSYVDELRFVKWL